MCVFKISVCTWRRCTWGHYNLARLGTSGFCPESPEIWVTRSLKSLPLYTKYWGCVSCCSAHYYYYYFYYYYLYYYYLYYYYFYYYHYYFYYYYHYCH